MIGPVLLTLLAAAAAPGQACAAARAALPQAEACVEQPGGIALASSEAAAREMLTQARAGEERFRTAFGRAPSRYAMFGFNDPATARTTSTALRALGYTPVLPLPSSKLRERQMADAVRRLQASGNGGTPGRIVQRASADGSGEPRGANHVPHELGHGWYANAFWPASLQTPPPTTRRYGSPAPDWLDEAAAMLMEDETRTLWHHQRLADGRSADAQRAAMSPPEVPLATLISMTHPALASLPAPGGADGPVSMVVIGRPSLFYAQVRVFTDYLIERSGDRRILAVVSKGLQGGATFDRWLGTHGTRHRLPTSLAAMQADWDGWLDRRFGAAQDAR